MRKSYNKVNEVELKNFINNHQQPQGLSHKVAEGLEMGQSGFFATVFSFFTTQVGKELLMVKPILGYLPLQVFVFPIAALLELGETAVAGYQLASAKNRNIEKSLNFAQKAVKAAIIVPAIVLGAAAVITGVVALGAAVPFMFLAALTLNTLYSVGNAIYHGVKMMQAPKGSALRAAHKQELRKNVVRSVVGVLFTVVIAGLFVAGVSTGVGLGVLAGIGLATVIGAWAVGRYMNYRAKEAATHTAKQAALLRNNKTVGDKPEPISEMKNTNRSAADKTIKTKSNRSARGKIAKTKAIASVIRSENIFGGGGKIIVEANQSAINSVEAATKAAGDRDDRFYVRDLVGIMSATGDDRNIKKAVFIKILDAKIAKLYQQISETKKKIDDAKESIFNRNAFFNVLIPDETEKRLNKIGGLQELKNSVIVNYGDKVFRPEDIDKIAENHPDIFQSFMHDKGDVELVFDAAKEFFTSAEPAISLQA